MRLRNIAGSRDVLAANEYVITEPESFKGRWNEVFGNDNPIYMEIGMGKGQFILGHAERNPEINYIGVEMYASVLIRAVQKAEGVDVMEGVQAANEAGEDKEMLHPNVRFLNVQAEGLENMFAPGEIDKIYLNFSDPWPKARHAKRRLTSTTFLGRYEKILKKDGILEFKTDNQDLFSFSLESIPEAGWELLAVTRDLHHESSMNEGNIMTEYEKKFSEKGQPICKLIAKQK